MTMMAVTLVDTSPALLQGADGAPPRASPVTPGGSHYPFSGRNVKVSAQ